MEDVLLRCRVLQPPDTKRPVEYQSVVVRLEDGQEIVTNIRNLSTHVDFIASVVPKEHRAKLEPDETRIEPKVGKQTKGK